MPVISLPIEFRRKAKFQSGLILNVIETIQPVQKTTVEVDSDQRYGSQQNNRQQRKAHPIKRAQNLFCNSMVILVNINSSVCVLDSHKNIYKLSDATGRNYRHVVEINFEEKNDVAERWLANSAWLILHKPAQ
ncbi:hypothetical protein M0813_23553 [Anaeramoeba flamelloides]|uniref:Uncharacterized protein n=1 Tax=Anaeramoeba flamelloides TaxID=1746091 RepID=A0ABQ8Y971_9EUKA|nr:hypothetical protein M0813_23553 [Anaeramoeba flamelloides]